MVLLKPQGKAALKGIPVLGSPPQACPGPLPRPREKLSRACKAPWGAPIPCSKSSKYPSTFAVPKTWFLQDLGFPLPGGRLRRPCGDLLVDLFATLRRAGS